MNTLELDEILRRTLKNCNFIGVFACDQLPVKTPISRPVALVVNTDPSHKPGSHWLAAYIDKHNTATFFDSFGNPPERFSKSIVEFLKENCEDIQYQARQLQSLCSTVCGQHCVFFLTHMNTCDDYVKFLTKFKDNTHKNDLMVCRYVKRLRPAVTCRIPGNVNCIQCAVSGELSLSVT